MRRLAVIGNGPSRESGLAALDVCHGHIVCNSPMLLGSRIPAPLEVVAMDAPQVLRCIECAPLSTRIVTTDPRYAEAPGVELIRTQGAFEDGIPGPWPGPATLESGVVYSGNMTGYLAFQRAVHVHRATEVVLVGMDVGGTLSEDGVTVSLSAEPQEGSYAFSRVPVGLCRESGETLLPSGWQARVTYWCRMIEWARGVGTTVYLANRHGALATLLPEFGASRREVAV